MCQNVTCLWPMTFDLVASTACTMIFTLYEKCYIDVLGIHGSEYIFCMCEGCVGVMTGVLTMSRRHAALSPAQSIGHDCKSTPESVTQYLSQRV